MNYTERAGLILPFWLLSSCYFLIPFIRDPIDPPALLITIDNVIPFVWWMIIPYYLYYVALFLPLLISERSRLQGFVSIAMQLLLISYAVFILWPITCETVMKSVEPNPLMYLYDAVEFSWLKQNALPSVHVAISGLTGLILANERPGLKWVFWIGALLVFFSTFLAKQHFMADGIAGSFLAIAGYQLWKRSF